MLLGRVVVVDAGVSEWGQRCGWMLKRSPFGDIGGNVVANGGGGIADDEACGTGERRLREGKWTHAFLGAGLVHFGFLLKPGVMLALNRSVMRHFSVFASSYVRMHNSSFVAHAAPLTSVDDIAPVLAHISALPALKRATHRMYAYRVANSEGDSDGGESGAGHRLARLLHLSRSDNVLVVVSRWYGGVKLGSTRWKCISTVAKDALNKGGFIKK